MSALAESDHVLTEVSDDELVQRVARFESAAMDVLFRRHSRAAFGLARHMLGSAGLAEDAVQEAFLSLWRNAARYDASKGQVRSWLLGIVRNRSIDMLRKLGVSERRRIAMDGVEQRIAGRDDDVEANVIRRDEAVAVRKALGTLPPDQRRVLELAYYGGWTQPEIADQLGLPLGTVKGRTRLGLTKLALALAEVSHSSA